MALLALRDVVRPHPGGGVRARRPNRPEHPGFAVRPHQRGRDGPAGDAGMVDAHVHFMDPGDPEREDFPAGTAAAARAGVTTVVEHTHAAPVITSSDLEDKRRHLAGRARVDFALAAHAWPDRLDEIPPVWRAGAAFVKAFTCNTHGLPGFDPAHLQRLLARASECRAVCLVHCEEDSLVADA